MKEGGREGRVGVGGRTHKKKDRRETDRDYVTHIILYSYYNIITRTVTRYQPPWMRSNAVRWKLAS